MGGSVIYNPELEYEGSELLPEPTEAVVTHDGHLYPAEVSDADIAILFGVPTANMVYGQGDGTYQQPYEPNNLPQYHPQNAEYQYVDMPYGNNSPAINALAGGYANAFSGVASPFEALMMGKVLQDVGGWGNVNNQIQNRDKMDAYMAQGAVADDVMRMVQDGYGIDEARYAATTQHLLGQGNNARAAIGWTMPQYGKEADQRGAKVLDATVAAGGDYQAKGAFGYVPNHINAVSPSQGTITIDGNTITGVAPEYLTSSVYGAIQGNGAGTKAAGNAYMQNQQQSLKNAMTLSDNGVKVAQLQYGAGSNGKGLSKKGGNGSSYVEKLRELADEKHRQKKIEKALEKGWLRVEGISPDGVPIVVPNTNTNTNKAGNTTGVKFVTGL